MRRTVFNYIECDYNRWRRHSACGGLSPEQFENQNHRADLSTGSGALQAGTLAAQFSLFTYQQELVLPLLVSYGVATDNRPSAQAADGVYSRS